MKSKYKKMKDMSVKVADGSKIVVVKDEHGNNVKRIPRGNHAYSEAVETLRYGKNWRDYKNAFIGEKNIKL